MRLELSRKRLYVTALAFAAVAAGALTLVSQLGAHAPRHAAGPPVAGAAENAHLFAGIPQHGNVLGSPSAPVTLVEYADMQCPYCGEFARDALPALVRDYVRTGKVRLVFRGLAFVGPDSETALRAVLAAGETNRLWTAAHLIYANQGLENSGWVTDAFLGSVANVVRFDLARAGSAAVSSQVARFEREASADGVRSTPTFMFGHTGGRLAPLVVHALEADAFRPALDRLVDE